MQHIKAVKFEIFGIVQGVGFRPFVYNLAQKLGICGEIYNDGEGVKIVAIANEKAIDNFENDLLKNLPPLARIDILKRHEININDFSRIISRLHLENIFEICSETGDEISIRSNTFNSTSRFIISPSHNTHVFNPLLPDFAICDDCLSEFYDPQNRRYHYAFINCVNCGPRLSIIKALPYDRKNTSMDAFKLCKECKKEYKNPQNRRFHAEPIACEICGPKLFLKGKNGNILATDEEAIKFAACKLKDGAIIALKGLGGFHLVCDAKNESAILRLRERKFRPEKPLAIMCANEKMAHEIAEISSDEREILLSNIKPIVLLKTRTNLPNAIAPNTDKIGIFIAPTGVHLLLFEYFHNPLIATSANISGEAIIFNERELLEKMGLVIDFYLDNEREIITPSDDSLCYVAKNLDENLKLPKQVFLRMSRGLRPNIFFTKCAQNRTILAIGAEQKNSFAIYKNGEIFLSMYIGDLKNPAVFTRFLHILEIFTKNYDLKFDEIIGDLHPHFLHTKYFERLGFCVRKIQHHYAHLLSVLSEISVKNTQSFLGFAFDGTGIGAMKTDMNRPNLGEIWGGEVMIFDKFGFERIFHFDEFPLIGGENAVKNIYKLAFSVLKKYNLPTKKLNLNELEDRNLSQIFEKCAVKTSSLGRIFDAFCAVVFGKNVATYDAMSGNLIEKFYDENCVDSYKFDLIDSVIIYKSAFVGALSDEPRLACSKFINAIAKIVAKIALKFDLEVVLSGGVFANQALMNATLKELKKHNKVVHFNTKNAINDENIAIGQLEFALNNKI